MQERTSGIRQPGICQGSRRPRSSLWSQTPTTSHYCSRTVGRMAPVPCCSTPLFGPGQPNWHFADRGGSMHILFVTQWPRAASRARRFRFQLCWSLSTLIPLTSSNVTSRALNCIFSVNIVTNGFRESAALQLRCTPPRPMQPFSPRVADTVFTTRYTVNSMCFASEVPTRQCRRERQLRRPFLLMYENHTKSEVLEQGTESIENWASKA